MAIQTTLEKNPGAFQPKISGNQLEMKFSDVLPYARHNKVTKTLFQNLSKNGLENIPFLFQKNGEMNVDKTGFS